jgi:hypothetical protein
MITHGEHRIEPAAEILAGVRAWLDQVRPALGTEFLAAYLTGSVLTQGFDAKRSRINVLVVARSLGVDVLDTLRQTIPATRKAPHYDPLFLTRIQIEKSLDAFPIEWLEIKERHMRLEGDDIFEPLEVPPTFLRLQCEHELRGKHIRLRQAYLLASKRPAELGTVLKTSASSFATLFRTLLRLRGETPPADSARVIERVADLFALDAQGLLGAHLVRYSGRRYSADEILPLYRKFLGEVDRLVTAIDQLRVA